MYLFDISQIAQKLSEQAEDVCRWLLPNGHREGSEWRIGSVEGEKGRSLGVNLEGHKGIWKDFSSDEKGGDLIDLIMQVKNLNKGEAIAEAKKFLGIEDNDPLTQPHKKTLRKIAPPAGMVAPQAQMIEWFRKRGISKKTMQKYRIAQAYNKEHQTVIVFPYFAKEESHDRDDLAFIKFRPLHDKKGMYTSIDSRPILFGWQAVKKDARSIVIVEGECDVLACSECGIDAVSVPRGGGKDGKQDCWIDNEWEHLQQFDTIYLALDMDSEGQVAAHYIARRLGQHRCFFVKFSTYKDANDALLAGVDLKKELEESAHTVDPDELVPASAFDEEVWSFFKNEERRHGENLPWKSTHDKLGLRNGETTIWAGINGHGKSMIVSHAVAYSVAHGGKWCIASMEFKPYKLLTRLYRQTLGQSRPLDFGDQKALNEFYANQLWLFNVQGSAKSERMLEVFEYAYRRYGITHFLIDSLAKAGFAEDDYSGQKLFVDKLSDFARNNDVQVHLVCHSRKKESEDMMPDKFDIKGSGGITDMVDNVYVVWRNKSKERKMQDGRISREELDTIPDAVLSCCKQREGDWEGRIDLWFDQASLQYADGTGEHVTRYC